MIDTDKYEGYTEGPWVLYSTASGGPKIAGKLNDADWQLIRDAPLLLAEVKWLRSLIEMVSYDLEWYPERFDQNKRKLAYNVRKWNGEEE